MVNSMRTAILIVLSFALFAGGCGGAPTTKKKAAPTKAKATSAKKTDDPPKAKKSDSLVTKQPTKADEGTPFLKPEQLQPHEKDVSSILEPKSSDVSVPSEAPLDFDPLTLLGKDDDLVVRVDAALVEHPVERFLSGSGSMLEFLVPFHPGCQSDWTFAAPADEGTMIISECTIFPTAADRDMRLASGLLEKRDPIEFEGKTYFKSKENSWPEAYYLVGTRAIFAGKESRVREVIKAKGPPDTKLAKLAKLVQQKGQAMLAFNNTGEQIFGGDVKTFGLPPDAAGFFKQLSHGSAAIDLRSGNFLELYLDAPADKGADLEIESRMLLGALTKVVAAAKKDVGAERDASTRMSLLSVAEQSLAGAIVKKEGDLLHLTLPTPADFGRITDMLDGRKQTRESESVQPPASAPAKSPASPKASPPSAAKPAENPVPTSTEAFVPGKPVPVSEVLEKSMDPKLASSLHQATVLIRGAAVEISYHPVGSQWSVVVADHRDPTRKLKCQLVESQPWLKVVPGQAVVVRGSFNLTFLVIEKAAITAVGENPLRVISADQLAAEYKEDRKAANRKYAGKWILCSGVVKNPEADHTELDVKGEVLAGVDRGGGPSEKFSLTGGQRATFLAKCPLRLEGQGMYLTHALSYSDEAVKSALAGLARYDPPPEELKPQQTTVRQPTPPPTMTFSVEAFNNKIVEENVVPSKAFANQWVTLDGVVSSDERYSWRSDRVILLDPAKTREQAHCLFDSPQDALRLMPGQKVKIKGQVPYSVEMTVVGIPALRHCELLQAGPNPVKSISADELVAEAKAEETKPRSDEEWLVCSGTFGGIRLGEVLVRGKDGAVVTGDIDFSLEAKEAFETCDEGAPIRVLGYRDRKADPAEASLRFCYPLKK